MCTTRFTFHNLPWRHGNRNAAFDCPNPNTHTHARANMITTHSHCEVLIGRTHQQNNNERTRAATRLRTTTRLHSTRSAQAQLGGARRPHRRTEPSCTLACPHGQHHALRAQQRALAVRGSGEARDGARASRPPCCHGA